MRNYVVLQVVQILVLIGLYFLKCTKFDQLILRKIIKIVATRCQILTLKCTKITALPKSPSWIQGGLLLRRGEGRGWDERKGGGLDLSASSFWHVFVFVEPGYRLQAMSVAEYPVNRTSRYSKLTTLFTVLSASTDQTRPLVHTYHTHTQSHTPSHTTRAQNTRKDNRQTVQINNARCNHINITHKVND